MHRLIGNGQAIFLPPPLPDGLVTGNALGLGSALAQGVLHRLRQERRFARCLGHRHQLRNAPLGLRGQPAPHRLAMDPEQTSHLATGPSLLGP
jgi:hypothetical protein